MNFKCIAEISEICVSNYVEEVCTMNAKQKLLSGF